MKLQIAAAFGGLIGVFALSGAAVADNITYGSYLSSHHSTNVASVEPWMRAVEKQTGGSLTFTLAADGTIVGGRDALAGIRDGLVDMSMIVDFYTPNELITSSILTELALLGSDEAVMTAAITDMQLNHCATCDKEAAENNLRVMGIYASSPYHFICNRKFEKAEDFKGSRVRATGSWAHFVTALGGTPVNVTSGEMYEALQRGQVDCTLINVPALTNYSLLEVAKYVIDLPVGTFHGGHVFNMNTNVWAKRSAEEKAAMLGNVPQALANLVEGAIRENTNARQKATEAGVTFVPADPSLVAALTEFQKNELTRVADLARSRGLADPAPIFAEFQQVIAKWEGIVAETGTDWNAYAARIQSEVFDNLKAE